MINHQCSINLGWKARVVHHSPGAIATVSIEEVCAGLAPSSGTRPFSHPRIFLLAWMGIYQYVHALFTFIFVQDLECDPIDITTTFLNCDLDEIYMNPSKGYKQTEKMVSWFTLLKGLHNLKQGKGWYLKLSEVMKEIGLRKAHNEPYIYVWEDRAGGEVVILTYIHEFISFAKLNRPMIPGLRLENPTSPHSTEEAEFMKDKPYLQVIGKLT